MSRQTSSISRKDLRARRIRLAMARSNPDWCWRKQHNLPEESPEWSATDAFDLAETLLASDLSTRLAEDIEEGSK